MIESGCNKDYSLPPKVWNIRNSDQISDHQLDETYGLRAPIGGATRDSDLISILIMSSSLTKQESNQTRS